MKVALIVYGSRGDVQPMLALATALMKKEHEVIFCASPDNEDFVKNHNCPFVPFGKNLKELFKNANIKGGISGHMSPKDGKRIIKEQIDILTENVKGSDLILAAGIVFGVPTVADSLKIPYRFVAFYPMILGTAKEDPFFNRFMFRLGRSMTNLLFRGFINKERDRLGAKPIKDFWQSWMGDDVIVACDKELSAVNETVSFSFTQTGYMFLPSRDKLSDLVNDFLSSGKPPVYIGFGSNPISGKMNYYELFNDISKATNQRLIVSKGWADLPENNNPDILFVDEISFELLFPQLSAIIHHGGTGTLAYAARSGVPQAAFPFIADQFNNRDRISELGLGPATCDFKKMTADSISIAITECIENDTYKKNAVEISQRLEHVNGLQLTMDLIEEELSN